MKERELRHAPKTGRARALLGRFHFTGGFWYRFHLACVRRLPDWTLRILIPLSTTVLFVCLPTGRRALVSNQTRVQGPAGWWTRHRRALRNGINFGWCLNERYEQFVPGKQPHVHVVDPDLWVRLTSEGTGLIVVTSHIGNWELGSTVPTSVGEPARVHVVREAEMDADTQDFVEEFVGELGGARYVTHFATDDPSLGLELLDALQKGEVVALQADRPREGGQIERVKILGHDFELPVGPVALARIANVPLLPSFTLRQSRRQYRVVFRDPIHVPRTRDRNADHRAALEEIGRALEWALREAPEQWFCFADLAELETQSRQSGP